MPDTVLRTECPPTAELERLVRGRLTDARSAAISEHIGACSNCQQRLEAITGGAEELTQNLRDCSKNTPPTDSAYYKALAAAEDEVRATALFLNGVADGESAAGAPLELEFLQPADEPDRLGKLGQFGILRVVGRGGMGVVLHAYDPCLARDVAVKVIDPQLAHNEVARQRFCREARAAAAVTHDNLVAVHQVDEDEHSGLPYLVMQLINGESLEQRLKRVGKLSPIEVARLGMQAAAGLAAAHAGGLVHRDIKPANILLESPVDRVKLTDFGLAKAAEDVKLTRTGFVAGSPLYMAPEQARGDDIDHRADLFSLGSVLYEAATGKPPFEAKTPLAVLRRVADETPPLLHTVNPDAPVWLSDVIDRLLAKAPADRYQTAAEVAEDFAAELARAHALSPLDVPAEVCAGASGSRTITTRARRQICWKGVAFRTIPWVGGALLGAMLLWLAWSPRTVEVAAPIPEGAAKGNGEPGPAPLATITNEAGGTVWDVAFLGDDQIVTGADDGYVRIWNWKKQNLVKTLEPKLNGTIWSVDVSADRKYVAAVCDDSRVTVWNLDDFSNPYEFPHPTSTRSAVFSPDGTMVATGDRGATIRVWDITAGIPQTLKKHTGTVYSLSYSPDGTKLASASSDGTAKMWNLEEPGTPITIAQHKGPVFGVAFNPDGTRIATAGWDGVVRICDLRGAVVKTIQAYEGDAWAVSFGNGGKWLATGGPDAVKVWDVESGKEIFNYRGRAFHAVRFAKDGKTLAAGARDGTVRVWEIGK